MRKYVLDTNVLIAGDRDEETGRDLKHFTVRAMPGLYLHSVVMQEMLAGATDAKRKRVVRSTLIRPYERRGRVLTPSHAAWKQAGEVMAELVKRRLMSPGSYAKSFVNDCLLASSCSENGVTIVTQNTRDFALLQRIIPVKIAKPWPE